LRDSIMAEQEVKQSRMSFRDGHQKSRGDDYPNTLRGPNETARGVRKEERPRRPSSFSDAREPVSGGAAGASIAIRSTSQPISLTMRLIMLATPQAVSRNGAAAVISLLPSRLGNNPALLFEFRLVDLAARETLL
jgi:hypothetical protein